MELSSFGPIVHQYCQNPVNLIINLSNELSVDPVTVLTNDVWKKIFQFVDFQNCTRFCWVSKNWKICIETSEVLTAAFIKFFGDTSRKNDQNLNKEILIKKLQMNITNSFVNTKGLTNKEINENTNDEQLIRGYKAQIQLSRIGLSTFPDIEKSAIFLQNYLLGNDIHWEEYFNEVFSQGFLEKAIEICENHINSEREIAGQKIISRLCESDQLERAITFYKNQILNFVNPNYYASSKCDHEMLDDLMGCIVKNQDFSAARKLISIRPQLELIIVKLIILSYDFNMHSLEKNMAYQNFITDNKEVVFRVFSDIFRKENNQDKIYKVIKILISNSTYTSWNYKNISRDVINNLICLLIEKNNPNFESIIKAFISNCDILYSKTFISILNSRLGDKIIIQSIEKYNVLNHLADKYNYNYGLNGAIRHLLTLENPRRIEFAELLINKCDKITSYTLQEVLNHKLSKELIEKCVCKCEEMNDATLIRLDEDLIVNFLSKVSDEDKNKKIRNILEHRETEFYDLIKFFIISCDKIEKETFGAIVDFYSFDSIELITECLNKCDIKKSELILKYPHIFTLDLYIDDVTSSDVHEWLYYALTHNSEGQILIKLIGKIDFSEISLKDKNTLLNNFLEKEQKELAMLIETRYTDHQNTINAETNSDNNSNYTGCFIQ
ncbi:MAG: hypothetical protein H0T62_07650 [Parachlamydiaceae bacterium]|nr:hypothetical protein [Parachlamydiaceae bacterium]